MKMNDVGFPRWLLWALFSPAGRIKRLPYVVSFVILTLFIGPYTRAMAEITALHMFPPEGGAAIDVAYVQALASSSAMIPALLPVFFVYCMLDIKRLRSLGLSLSILLPLAVAFAALTTYPAILAPGLLQPIALTGFAYHAILAVIPAKEDRLHPLERKAMTWKAIATGDGTPRRLSGKDIKQWRIVRQGPA
ncbi:MAG: hypothetical protein LBH65_05275 [Desulfovibrio sp.]|jgi:uncharacterized membrane protein YhaH (DUF805 family)|nr:hypothetical protein [Desulfovibrio sp.]